MIFTASFFTKMGEALKKTIISLLKFLSISLKVNIAFTNVIFFKEKVFGIYLHSSFYSEISENVLMCLWLMMFYSNTNGKKNIFSFLPQSNFFYFIFIVFILLKTHKLKTNDMF